ncbi:MAG: B12-binding domain-containing radical SAM protein [Methanotrichaceae archaeon]|nr:B12-binding domain-containing radical SAM protein [Methanotrichaceae archaeon]
MRVSLVGAELDENLGIRYMAAALESRGHDVNIVPFNSEADIASAVKSIMDFAPDVVGLSMVFTNRGREFCHLANVIRQEGFRGHLIAGGPFASFNYHHLLRDHSAIDSIALGEGEVLICTLADNLDDLSKLPGLCYRKSNGTIEINPPGSGNDDLDSLPFPKRTELASFFDKKVASVLTSRGCWRNCAFCSINAWYDRVGGKKFRVRSINSVVEEMKDLYRRHGVRIFNFQDDNFFLPDANEALNRFEHLRDRLDKENVKEIAIAIKARPDSITRDSVAVLDDLGLFRVFLGVENASENGLRNLNRRSTVDQAIKALGILNDFDIHIAYNLLIFEPDTTMEDIMTNLRFVERNIENPFNFCRAEVHAGTGLETKLKAENRLLGDYFGLDYRLKDPQCEAFHQIANLAFYDRNFSDNGLHYFNMQVDFCFQILRRFNPEVLSQTLRGAVKNLIKQTNLDTYQYLCRIYDFVESMDIRDNATMWNFSKEIKAQVDVSSRNLHLQGGQILSWLEDSYREKSKLCHPINVVMTAYEDAKSFTATDHNPNGSIEFGQSLALTQNILTVPFMPIPYHIFKNKLAQGGG